MLGIKSDATINPQLLPIKAEILMNTTCKDNIGKAVITFKDTVKKIDIVCREETPGASARFTEEEHVTAIKEMVHRYYYLVTANH